MKFDYYYGEESEQYSFYSVPKMFFSSETFAGLSAMSKLLYGFLLDRMSLSRKRNWIDDKNRAYIKYSLNAITKDMGVSKNSVIKYMRELQEFGLIMKYPNEGMEDIIYVMDYSKVKQANMDYRENIESDGKAKVLHLDNSSEQKAYDDTGQAINYAPPNFNTTALDDGNNIKKIQDEHCKGESTLRGGAKSELVQNLHRFKTCTGAKSELVQNLNHQHKENNNINNISKTDKTDKYIYNNLANPSNLSINLGNEMDKTDRIEKKCRKKITAKETAISADCMYEHISELVKTNIDYYTMRERPECAGWYDEYYNLIVEVLSRRTNTIRISGEEYSAKFVQDRFSNLRSSDLLYVHTQMSRITSDIKNIKAYLISALFNAPTTLSSYWESRVNHDMANGIFELEKKL